MDMADMDTRVGMQSVEDELIHGEHDGPGAESRSAIIRSGFLNAIEIAGSEMGRASDMLDSGPQRHQNVRTE